VIEQLPSPSEKVFAFKLSGKLHDEDYKKFVPLVDAAIAKETAELQRLERTDPERFEYAPWRNTRMTGEERLAQIARAGK